MTMPTNADAAGAAVRWIPCLLIEGEPLPCGITTSYPERLPGCFYTHEEALRAAVAMLGKRPDAIGAVARRQEGAA